MEKCENQDRKQVEKCEKDSYLYGTLLWVVDMERDSYSLFFSLGGGVSENSDSKIDIGNHGTYIGNLIRRGNEPSATDDNKSRIYNVRGRIRGHMALNGSEYTLFSIISLEIGKDISRIPLGDYRGNIDNSILPDWSALSVCECIALLSQSLCSLFSCSAWFVFCHRGVVQTFG